MGLFSRKSKKDDEKLETKKLPPDQARGGEIKKIETRDEKKVGKKSEGIKPTKSVKAGVRRFGDVERVLVRPLVTEKISNMGMYNQYAFRVSSEANKIQIKKAVETYYKVKPVRVNIVNIRGKNVRWGRTRGMTRGWKKAVITLRQGDKIELYEGV